MMILALLQLLSMMDTPAKVMSSRSRIPPIHIANTPIQTEADASVLVRKFQPVRATSITSSGSTPTVYLYMPIPTV
ncbi:hypothetical protein BGZ61DRAFT_208040 [Ilyonectria robusta]|uniref:uncharacterized protein n=1 Tax=Ilyonectria robusta TaxID=1079257 RepID=UPI001E8CDCE8|nr:uncharacterized protein BGZ61DRAFT_208040 [Ilyonectria robusta]KAH8714218.1 hypothetical protein BGZ61DRAFT_208040 [Ilyonectria robusta]